MDDEIYRSDSCTADAMVKVPQMAESISEGTLKQFSKGGFDVSLHTATLH